MYVADYINQDLLFYPNPDADRLARTAAADGVTAIDARSRRGR